MWILAGFQKKKKKKLYENLTYGPHLVHGYRIKLQHHKYTERRTSD